MNAIILFWLINLITLNVTQGDIYWGLPPWLISLRFCLISALRPNPIKLLCPSVKYTLIYRIRSIKYQILLVKYIILISTVNSASQRTRGVFRQNEEHILEVAWLHKSQQEKKKYRFTRKVLWHEMSSTLYLWSENVTAVTVVQDER